LTFKSSQSEEYWYRNAELTLGDRRQRLRQWLQFCRTATLALVEDVDYETLCHQAHPDFSPMGWHLGHIAYTEALWILQHFAGLSPQFPQYHRLFAARGLPKAERQNLPTLAELHYYLNTIREQVLIYLDIAPLNQQECLWHWLLQHESQHNETMTLVRELLERQRGMGNGEWGVGNGEWGMGSGEWGVGEMGEQGSKGAAKTENMMALVEVPAGYFEQGNDSWDALDNERPVHRVYLDTYWIDRYPVTCQQYGIFMEAGGYCHSEWWSAEGWSWLQQNPVAKPLYWSDNPEWDDHPVCGVSWYEAEAYARFVGKRLPSEAEWEKAVSWNPELKRRCVYPWGDMPPTSRHCNHDHWVGHTTPVNAYPRGQSFYGCADMLGNVWEWTANWFDGYEGFQPYPYRGYSQAYFDQQHRVLRGGSWATRPWVLRGTLRNWYQPGVRQIFAGFRCAYGSNRNVGGVTEV
jgi:ergothioneine biosynthesis protein EgtB